MMLLPMNNRKLFDQGSRWIDDNLFRGEFISSRFAASVRTRFHRNCAGGMGSENTEQPEYQ